MGVPTCDTDVAWTMLTRGELQAHFHPYIGWAKSHGCHRGHNVPEAVVQCSTVSAFLTYQCMVTKDIEDVLACWAGEWFWHYWDAQLPFDCQLEIQCCQTCTSVDVWEGLEVGSGTGHADTEETTGLPG